MYTLCTHTDDSLTLDNLLIQLRPQVTSEWYKFGLALGVAEEVLNKYLGYPSEECIVEMLDNWLRNHGSKPTWKEVAKALKDIGLLQLAEDILKVYTTGKSVKDLIFLFKKAITKFTNKYIILILMFMFCIAILYCY